MHRRARAQHECRRTSEEFRLSESRVSGEIFIEPQPVSVMSSIETRCALSRLNRKVEGKIVRFYRYFAPAALAILLLSASPIFCGAALAQRRTQGASSSSIPSPRSVLGFNPGDDRTIADWKQITDYFARLVRS